MNADSIVFALMRAGVTVVLTGGTTEAQALGQSRNLAPSGVAQIIDPPLEQGQLYRSYLLILCVKCLRLDTDLRSP